LTDVDRPRPVERDRETLVLESSHKHVRRLFGPVSDGGQPPLGQPIVRLTHADRLWRALDVRRLVDRDRVSVVILEH
jgi:hypothetical protein